jgi:hypothetical protein
MVKRVETITAIGESYGVVSNFTEEIGPTS